MNRKAPELHLIDGSKPERPILKMPESIKKRIPKAEWLEDYDAWDKDRFINETADFLWEAYGIGNDQDRHTLGMLAEQIDLYVKCSKGIKKNGVIATFNNGATVGPNPYIPIRNKTMHQILQLMNELGLTPRTRLMVGPVKESSQIGKLLKGPKG